MPLSDRIIQLRHATLAQIAAELQDRASVACPNCHGYGDMGDPDSGYYRICPACNGTGREPWPELRVTAERLECLANSLPV